MSEEPVDVVIVGSGAAGAEVAWSLAETRMKILCLEQGQWMDPGQYPSTRRDWEMGPVSAPPTGYPVNNDEADLPVTSFSAVGGTTILYGGHFPRFHPSDFRVKTLDGVADDWPIDHQVLWPYYAENDRMTGVSGLAGDPAYPAKKPVLPPLPLGKSGEALARGFNSLGWHWWPSDTAILTEQYDGRDKCINLGACTRGCAQGAKASTDITYWPHALRSGVELRSGCRVREITVNDKGLASGVIYYDADGNEHRQTAEVVILACNGVGTPRLLLNSRSNLFPDGLGNSSGLVGKNLMLHPYATIFGTFEEPLDGYRGPGHCIQSQQFYETELSRGFVRGYTLECVRGRGHVNTARGGVISGRVPFGHDHHRAYRDMFNRIAGMLGICEDLPELHNSVTLDPALVDASGIPAPKVSYRISDNSRKMLEHAMARGEEVLRAAGANDIQSGVLRGGGHLMGTARMGRDPAKSVVNEWGRCHDVKNVFIVDGSIFVTSAGVNPTRTIQALALYVADSMKQRLASLFD
jgi:choline dehydrogenase-like flavoprotein